MSAELTSAGGMMQKIIVWLFAACSILSVCSVYDEQALPTSRNVAISGATEERSPSLIQGGTTEGAQPVQPVSGPGIEPSPGVANPRQPIGAQNPPFHGKSETSSQDQDFYKATVQAYKDFNEQTVKYFSIALAVVSILVTVFVTWCFFMFRKTLAEIRIDLARDADRLRDVYSRTFDLLNEQAKTNLEIFKSRESELKTEIREAQNLYEKIKTVMNEISNDQRVREPVAERLAQEKATKAQEETQQIKDEVQDYKRDLEEFAKDKS